MSFRLWTIFYVFALIASAMATFGATWGIVAALFVIGLWAWLFSPCKPHTVVGWLAVVGPVLLVCFFWLGTCVIPRELARRESCRNGITQLAHSLIRYTTANGTLPSAYLPDATGKPVLSWRVALVPDLEFQGTSPAIDNTKAWDAPANKAMALASPPYEVNCPSDGSNVTASYFAVVGAQTAWPGAKGCKLSDISDGTATTILLIEAHGRPVIWSEPRDLTFEEAVDLLSRPVPLNDGHAVNNGFFYKQSRGRFVAFADTRVQLLTSPLDRHLAAALLTVNGHEIGRASC